MPVLRSSINTKSETFIANAEHMQAQVNDLLEKIEQICKGGGEKAAERHVSRGKLLPRDRINALIDDDTPFLEIGQLAAWEVYDDYVPCAGVVLSLIHI